MGQHLELVAQGEGGMTRLCFQELIVKAAAVADPVSFRVEGQTGHQNQCGHIIGNRLVGNGLRNARIALFHFAQIVHKNETHFVPVAFGNGYPLAIPERLLQHGNGADFLIVGKITINCAGVFIGFGGQEQLAKGLTAADNLSFRHGTLLLPDHPAEFFLIHLRFPPFFVWRGGTAGTTGI